MFTCHCEVAPAQPVVGGTETEQVSRQRGENILKAGTACAKALRFESLNNEEAMPCAIHAAPTPASSSAVMDCLPWGVIRLENQSTGGQRVAWLKKLM